jgi:hypothetical protein
MMKAVNAKEFDMVATWSVDRLGRSLTDLLGILQGLHDKGVGLFLHARGYRDYAHLLEISAPGFGCAPGASRDWISSGRGLKADT